MIEKSGTDVVGIVNLNEKDFEIGETVRGENLESLLSNAIANGDRDITDYYKLNTGQRPTFYDYSFIERNKEFSLLRKN